MMDVEGSEIGFNLADSVTKKAYETFRHYVAYSVVSDTLEDMLDDLYGKGVERLEAELGAFKERLDALMANVLDEKFQEKLAKAVMKHIEPYLESVEGDSVKAAIAEELERVRLHKEMEKEPSES